MIRSSRSVFFCLFLFSSLGKVQAQQVEAALAKLAAHPVEKIYIHYDKEYYVTGETIYFKAYLYSNGKPSGLSNNLFMQFADSKGGVVSTKKFPVMGAVARGSIDIPDSLPQGNYYLRALTPVMLNEQEEFVYKKNLFIFKPSFSESKEKQPVPNLSLQFFPESGDMVDGILTTVAFKAVDQLGNPVDVSGVIRTSDGTNITSFKSFHDGIGKVLFKPQAGKKYEADVETTVGKRTYPLPEVKESGINLKLLDEKGGKKFQISRGDKDKNMFERIRLVAQINNQVVNDFEITFEDYPSVIGHLVTDSLPSGILHFTVFNNDGIPIAERLSFVNNREYASTAKVDAKLKEEKRSKNEIELSFDEALQRSCSVSITDASGGSFNDQDNIWSRFLLTSDLKGYVNNPAWYFQKTNDSTKQGLDNLMLTHGWTRFTWTNLLANEARPNRVDDEPMISLSGKVKDEKSGDFLSNGLLTIYFEAEDSSSMTHEIPVDASGTFHIDSLLFYGKAKLYYGYIDIKRKPKETEVIIDANPFNKILNTVPSAMFAHVISRDPASMEAKSEIDNRYNYVKSKLDDVKELEKVTVQSKSNKTPEDIVNEKYTSGVFKGPGKVNLDNINDPANDRSMNVVDYIRNRIPQVEIQGGRFVNRKNFSLMTGQKWAVGVFINEVPADIFQLRLLRTMDVALVKFYDAGFVGVGSSFPGGALAVYTKERDTNDEKPDKLKFVEYNGYSISKEFYNPDYENPNARKILSDNRTTLYWNPDVFMDDETKTIKLDFYNNDFSRKVKVVVEGFDVNGKLIHIEKIIQ